MSDYKLCANGHYYQGDNCPYCNGFLLIGGRLRGRLYWKSGEPWRIKETGDTDADDGIVGEYKQCNSGHYYKGDFCPYCPQQWLPEKELVRYKKSCPNRHAYDAQEQECPICGSKDVVSEYESGRDTVESQYVVFDVPEVKINGESIYGVQKILVYVSRGNRDDYCFIDHMKKEYSFEPGDDMQIGETRLKGKEIMRVCDMALDNNLSILVQK